MAKKLSEQQLTILVPVTIECLKETARTYHKTITYQDLANEVQTRSGVSIKQPMRYWIGSLLGTTNDIVTAIGETVRLTSLCVKQDGTIGEGYDYVAGSVDDLEDIAALDRLDCYKKYAVDLPSDGGSPALTPQVEARRLKTHQKAQAQTTRPTCPIHHIELPKMATATTAIKHLCVFSRKYTNSMLINEPETLGGQLFVDESKSKDYLLVATIIQPHQLALARRNIKNLVLPGQRRIHMNGENDRRKKQILAVINEIEPQTLIYRAKLDIRKELARRNVCLETMVRDAVAHLRTEVVIELDTSLERSDQVQIAKTLSQLNANNKLAYRHATASSEMLLVIPDAIGWAWARGGDWRHRITNMVTVINV